MGNIKRGVSWDLGVRIFAVGIIFLMIFSGCNLGGNNQPSHPAPPPPVILKVSYVYTTDLNLAQVYQTLLEANGYQVTLIPKSEVATTDFKLYNLIILGADTTWSGGGGEGNVIENSGKPVILMGFGASNFFEATDLKLYLRKSRSMSWWSTSETGVEDPANPIWTTPNPIDTSSGKVTVYEPAASTSITDIILDSFPECVVGVGVHPGLNTWHRLIQEQRYFFWGFSGLDYPTLDTTAPLTLTTAGRMLFLNVVYHMVSQPPVLAYINFEQYGQAEWPLPSAWQELMPGTGMWSIEFFDAYNKQLRFTGKSADGVNDDYYFGGDGLTFGDFKWTDIRLSVKIKPITGGQWICLGRITEDFKQYTIYLDGAEVGIYRPGFQGVFLASAPYTYTPGTFCRIAVNFQGTRIKVFMDGSATPILNVDAAVADPGHTPITNGKIVIFAGRFPSLPGSAAFDDIIVTQL